MSSQDSRHIHLMYNWLQNRFEADLIYFIHNDFTSMTLQLRKHLALWESATLTTCLYSALSLLLPLRDDCIERNERKTDYFYSASPTQEREREGERERDRKIRGFSLQDVNKKW